LVIVLFILVINVSPFTLDMAIEGLLDKLGEVGILAGQDHRFCRPPDTHSCHRSMLKNHPEPLRGVSGTGNDSLNSPSTFQKTVNRNFDSYNGYTG
jgi:hypothetical protein